MGLDTFLIFKSTQPLSFCFITYPKSVFSFVFSAVCLQTHHLLSEAFSRVETHRPGSLGGCARFSPLGRHWDGLCCLNPLWLYSCKGHLWFSKWRRRWLWRVSKQENHDKAQQTAHVCVCLCVCVILDALVICAGSLWNYVASCVCFFLENYCCHCFLE